MPTHGPPAHPFPAAGAAGLALFLAALFMGADPVHDQQSTAAQAVAAPSAPSTVIELPPPVHEAASPIAAPKEISPTAPPPAVAPVKTTAVVIPPALRPSSATAETAPGRRENAAPREEPAMSGTTGEAGSGSAATANTPSQSFGATVELRGLVQKEGAPPRFRVLLNAPGGRNRTMDIVLGDTVYGPWKALEYNTSSKKLTLSNTERLVVLDTGEKVDLPE